MLQHKKLSQQEISRRLWLIYEMALAAKKRAELVNVNKASKASTERA